MHYVQAKLLLGNNSSDVCTGRELKRHESRTRTKNSLTMSFGNGTSAGPKILAVDDEAFNLDLMEHHLGRAGYQVVRAEDGIIALQKLEDDAGIELIVLDRMMPNLGGMEALRRIKTDARFQDIPVVMQTAAAAADQVLEGIKAGAYYYLTKPYKGTTLLGIVRAALEDARTKTSTVRRKFRPLSRQAHAASGFPVKVQRKGLAMVSLK